MGKEEMKGCNPKYKWALIALFVASKAEDCPVRMLELWNSYLLWEAKEEGGEWAVRTAETQETARSLNAKCV